MNSQQKRLAKRLAKRQQQRQQRQQQEVIDRNPQAEYEHKHAPPEVPAHHQHQEHQEHQEHQDNSHRGMRGPALESLGQGETSEIAAATLSSLTQKNARI